MRLLLLSNSTNYGQAYLEHAKGELQNFLGDSVPAVLFVPFAAVRFAYDDYAARVRKRFEAWGYGLTSLHAARDPEAAVVQAEAIVVGGGNTFHLVHGLYAANALAPIRKRVQSGVPYIGWSAGANVACPSLATTNDMPIIEPPHFRTLGLVPFQINPHYVDTRPEGHMGESREERILEFSTVNPAVTVVGLREGSMLRRESGNLTLLGEKPMRVFRQGAEPRECWPGAALDFLLT